MKSFKVITHISLFSLLFVCNIATAQKVDNQSDNSKEYNKTLCQKNLDRERFGLKKGKISAGLGIARASIYEKKDEEEVNGKIKISPNSASNYGYRADLMIKKKNYKKALSDLNIAIAIAPNQVSYYVQRAKLKIEYLKDINQGLTDFDKAIKLEPYNYLTYWSRAFVFKDIKNHEAALKDLDKALLLKPHKADIAVPARMRCK